MTVSRNRGVPGASFRFVGLVFAGLLLSGVLLAPPAFADFDNLFFSVNGDTSLTTMTQGDEFYWASNCDSGATVNFEVWYDANSSSTIEPSIDFMLTSENITDGNAVTESDPILDGFTIGDPIVLFGEPGAYVFKATDLATDSSLLKTLTMVAMSSPPNQLTGQIFLPGISAPNSLLANKAVFAEADTGIEGALFGMTNDMGNYTLSISSAGTGVEFFIGAPQVNGFITPDYIAATASGVVAGNDFTYTAASDSVWGFVKDETGTPLSFETDIQASSGDSDRGATTSGGRYVLYFSSGDEGEWDLEVDSRMSPLYLTPDAAVLDLDGLMSFQQDITLNTANAMVYARVTENGGLPTSNYRVDARSSSLGGWTEAVSGLGADNLVTLHVSSLDASDWTVLVSTWDDDYPIPAPLIVSGEVYNVSLGDTVTMTVVDGYEVAGTVTQDAGDAPIVWDDVYVAAGLYGSNVGGGGAYSFYADTGIYYMGAYADGYISNPELLYLELTSDTSSGLDFVINEAHCRVVGTLTNVSLPLPNPWYTVVARTGTNEADGYHVIAQIDSATGTYEMNLGDGDWTIVPPCCFPDLNTPANIAVTIGEAPDTARTIDLVYTPVSSSCCIGSTVGDCNQSGGVDITDIQIMVDHQFLTFQPLICIDEGDIDFSGSVDITDLQTMLDYQFISLTPFPPCP
ncbi:MAG: hypothetical protein GY867_12575 [bacterium]|nr:hypothetical protein [bacterium]